VADVAIPHRAVPRVRIARLRDFALVPAIILIGIVGQIVSPVFLHSDNLLNVLQQMSEVGLLVLAQTLVLLVGKMDLSLESTFGLAPGIAAWIIAPAGVAHGLGLLSNVWAIPIVLLVGAAIGLINALLIVRFGLNGFIVTLGMLITLRGLLTGISEGQTFFQLPSSMTYLGQNSALGIPLSVWICVGLFAAAGGVLGFTRWGRSLYAIGGNVDAARAAGIRTSRVLFSVLIVASLLAALGGLLISGRLASVAANQGSGAIFTVFAAAVIGGVSLNGGKGSVFGALTGVLTLQLVVNVMTLAGVPPLWNQFLNGAIIIVALIISRFASGEKQE
jgi:simple sugar transport system permease protein